MFIDESGRWDPQHCEDFVVAGVLLRDAFDGAGPASLARKMREVPPDVPCRAVARCSYEPRALSVLLAWHHVALHQLPGVTWGPVERRHAYILHAIDVASRHLTHLTPTRFEALVEASRVPQRMSLAHLNEMARMLRTGPQATRDAWQSLQSFVNYQRAQARRISKLDRFQVDLKAADDPRDSICLLWLGPRTPGARTFAPKSISSP